MAAGRNLTSIDYEHPQVALYKMHSDEFDEKQENEPNSVLQVSNEVTK
jgi:hypothetical protein